MRASEYTARRPDRERDLPAHERERLRAERELLDQATRLELDRRLTRSEQRRAREYAVDPRIDAALAHSDQYGLAEYLAAAPMLWRRWRDGSDLESPAKARVGAAIVAAAVDCRRAGFTRPVPELLLHDLYRTYLEQPLNHQLSPAAFHDGLMWASTPIQATSALLRRMSEGYAVFDYLVDLLQALPDPAPVPPATWERVLGDLEPTDAVGVAGAAYRAGQPAVGDQASRISIGVPALPAVFVSRPDLLAQAKAALLQLTSDLRSRMVGLIGMGGSGKSVMARALAHDEQIRRAFPDGIVWLELGPEPDLMARQAELAGALGDARPIVTLNQGLERLNGLLRGTASLVILDNVWKSEHLRAFDLLEPASALLVTTRDRDVLAPATTAIAVGLLPDMSALQLLAAWTGQPPESLPAEAVEVAKECGGLPLALAIAGGLVADGRSWSNVLRRLRGADLDKLQSRFGDYPYPSLLRSIEASVGALTAEQHARYLELAVFEGKGDVPVAVVHWLWQEAGLNELDCEDFLALLVRRSLVQHDPASNTLTLHNLQGDYLRRELGHDQLCTLHMRLTTAYLARWGGLDANLPVLQSGLAIGDPLARYGLRHLVSHLASADQAAEIHRLLALEWPEALAADNLVRANNVWYLVHEWAWETIAYLHDIHMAWRFAEAATDKQLAQGELASSIGWETRYALVSASVISVAKETPAVLPVVLVDQQMWTPAQALAYARTIASPWDKTRALVTLLPYLPGPERSAVIGDLRATARAIDDTYRRAQALVALAQYLPGPERSTIISDARALNDRERRPQVLGPSLEEEQRSIPTLSDATERARALVALASYLPEPERSTAIRDARATVGTVSDWEERVQTIIGETLGTQSADLLSWNQQSRADLRDAVAKGRSSAAANLAISSGIIARLGGVDAVRASARALRDVARWWP